MALILRKCWEGYQILFDDLTDPRTKSLPFVAKPYQTITVLVLYLMFVLKWGPKFMHKRKPFNLKNILIVYNAAQVLACAYIFYAGIILGWGWRYKWLCEPVDTSHSEHALSITRCVYYYYMSKFADLFDTIFFVLRKKQNQVSFLHLYHHTGMVLLVWGAITYYPGGHGTLIGVINSFVHIVMYSYYLITVIYPQARNSISWKKRITQLQILQFLWCVIHMAAIVFIPGCGYPRWTSAVFLPQNIFMLVLFIDFYIKTYIKKPQKTSSVAATVENGNASKSNFKKGKQYSNEVCYKEKKELNLEYNNKENGVSLNGLHCSGHFVKEKHI